MVIGMAEFLTKVGNLKRTQEKVDALRANDSLILRVILQACYDPSVKFDLPPGVPPYTPNKALDQQYVLLKEAPKMFKYFIAAFYPEMKPLKRETLFVEFLEALDPKDAQLVCDIKEKTPIKGITLAAVTEAFPDLIPNQVAA